MDRVHQKGQQPAKELGEGYIILTPSINNELLGDLFFGHSRSWGKDPAGFPEGAHTHQ